MKIVSVDDMHRLEKAADAAGHSYAAMMDMAGRAVAVVAENLLLPPSGRVLVLVGPGNNGGDGIVATRVLLDAGHHVTLYMWRRDARGDPVLQKLKRRRRNIAILWADNDPAFSNLREELGETDVVVDALLGTGAARPIEGRLAEILGVVREEVAHRRLPEHVAEADELTGPIRFPGVEALTYGMPPDLDDDDDDDDWDDDDFAFDDLELPEIRGVSSRSGVEGPDAADDEASDEGEDGFDPYFTTDPPPIRPFPAPAILAVDCPSGLNCDSGQVDPATIPADVTVTFAYPKWGHYQHPGAAMSGVLAVAPIGIPANLADDVQVGTVEPFSLRPMLPPRPPNAHKGTFGRAVIVAGSMNFTGAAFLAGSAAARSGTGLVTLAIPSVIHAALAGALPEATWVPMPAADGALTAEGVPNLLASLATADALLVGPGLTTLPHTVEFLQRLLGPEGLARVHWHGRMVVDADALNILATLPDWPALLPAETILTPHPGEMGRLTRMDVGQVNAERIANARRCAAEWGHVVLLKGAHTVVANPDGRTAVLPFVNALLATAGSGDVLAGAIAAMLAQGLEPFEAAVCGAYIHGHSGVLASRKIGMAGVVARDLISLMPEALTQLYDGAFPMR